MGITFAQLETKIREIVANDPQHIYQRGTSAPGTGVGGCFYSVESVGAIEACLFGSALAELGVTEEWLATHEGAPVSTLLNALQMEPTSKQLFWTRHLQTQQDGGIPWGAALESADERYPLR